MFSFSNGHQRKIGRDVDSSFSAVHDITKRLKEFGGISLKGGKGAS